LKQTFLNAQQKIGKLTPFSNSGVPVVFPAELISIEDPTWEIAENLLIKLVGKSAG
jgi:hypothetical protein